MAARTRQTHPSSTLKNVKLFALLLIAMIIWHTTSLQVVAAPELPPDSLDPPGVQAAAASTLYPGRLEATLTFSQAITPTLTAINSPGVTGAICPPVAEGEAITPSSSHSSLVFELLSLTRSVLPGAGLKERINILLLGGDNRPGEKYGHTDAMMLVTVEPATHLAAMLSIPRDLWVSIPGYGEGRINQVYRTGQLKEHPGGGAALLMATIEANLGVPVDYYVLINFDGFIQIIDTLGGVEVCVPEMVDAATHYGFSKESINKDEYYSFMPLSVIPVLPTQNDETSDILVTLSGQNMGYRFLYIEPGLHNLDGTTALRYARSRASITADFARVQRQQAVLMAIKNKALQLNILPIIPELWKAMAGLVETNLKLTDMVKLARLIQTIPSTNIQTGAIGQSETIDYKTGSGARILLPKREAIKMMIESMFGPANPTAPLTQAEIDAAAQNNQTEHQ